MAPPASGKHPLLAGALAGGVEICCTFPIEYTKTQLQLQGSRTLSSAGGAAPFRGAFSCVAWTVRERGVGGLYKGLPSWLYFAFPRVAGRFYIYEKLRGEFEAPGSALHPSVAKLAAGSLAGCVEGAVFQTPMLAIQTKLNHDMTAAKPRYKGLPFLKAVAQIARTEGVRKGLYPGVLPNVVKSAINRGVRFMVYGDITAFVRRSRGLDADARLGLTETLLSGACAGAVSVVVTHPVDTVRANMQGLSADKYKGMLDCARQIVAHGGARGLFQGMATRFTRVCIETGLIFSLYEGIDDAVTGVIG